MAFYKVEIESIELVNGSESNKVHRRFTTSFFDTKDGAYRLPVLKKGDQKIMYNDGRQVTGKMDSLVGYVSHGMCVKNGEYEYMGPLN
jgi:hypothetical protein